MLYWNTVSKPLKESLTTLMKADELASFRLVGGTALSLHLGHRVSVDIDLFTDEPYNTIDFDAIEHFLKRSFNYVSGDFGMNPGMGKPYTVGNDKNNAIKLDIFYSMDPFFQPLTEQEGIRIATVEELIAMKVDVIQRGGRKKDFWDLHELLSDYNIKAMIALHNKRFEWTHDEDLIIQNFTNFIDADSEPDPICLRNKEWVLITEDIEEAVANR